MKIKIQARAPKTVAENIAKLQGLIDGQDAFNKEHGGDIPDCKTPEGMELAETRRKAYKALRLEVKELHKESKAFYLKNGQLIDAAKKTIGTTNDPVEESLKTAINAEKTRVEQIAQAARDKEEARINEIKEHLSDIRTSIAAPNIDEAIEILENLNLQPFQEYAEDAETEAEAALKILRERKAEEDKRIEEEKKLETERVKREEEQAAESARLQKQKDEQDERERKLKEQQDAINAEKARVAAEAQALEDKKAADIKAEQERKEAAEREEQARIQAAKDEVERVKREKLEAEQLAARNAALLPDAEKLEYWVNTIHSIDVPELKDQDGPAMKAKEKILDELHEIGLVANELIISLKKAA